MTSTKRYETVHNKQIFKNVQKFQMCKLSSLGRSKYFEFFQLSNAFSAIMDFSSFGSFVNGLWF